MAAPNVAKVLERLQGTARELVALIGAAHAPTLRQAPGDGGWSPATVIAHLADAELVYGVRVRMMVADSRPYLVAFDEEAWVRRFAELEPDAKESQVRWRVVREANLRLFESLADEEWQLVGIHAQRGEMTVAQVAELLANHDRDHLNQIRAALA